MHVHYRKPLNAFEEVECDYNFKGSRGRRGDAPLIAAVGVGRDGVADVSEFSGASVTDEFP